MNNLNYLLTIVSLFMIVGMLSIIGLVIVADREDKAKNNKDNSVVKALLNDFEISRRNFFQ